MKTVDVRRLPWDACKTQIWMSDAAISVVDEFRKRGDPDGRFWKCVKRYAQQGFGNYIGDKCPIRPEWDGVHRIGIKSSLFRMIGFFPGDGLYGEFIVIDAFLKKGQKLNDSERNRINSVAAVKLSVGWRRVHD
jgi:hypothetical protein